jgi:hypothetical protein
MELRHSIIKSRKIQAHDNGCELGLNALERLADGQNEASDKVGQILELGGTHIVGVDGSVVAVGKLIVSVGGSVFAVGA